MSVESLNLGHTCAISDARRVHTSSSKTGGVELHSIRTTRSQGIHRHLSSSRAVEISASAYRCRAEGSGVDSLGWRPRESRDLEGGAGHVGSRSGETSRANIGRNCKKSDISLSSPILPVIL